MEAGAGAQGESRHQPGWKQKRVQAQPGEAWTRGAEIIRKMQGVTGRAVDLSGSELGFWGQSLGLIPCSSRDELGDHGQVTSPLRPQVPQSLHLTHSTFYTPGTSLDTGDASVNRTVPPLWGPHFQQKLTTNNTHNK